MSEIERKSRISCNNPRKKKGTQFKKGVYYNHKRNTPSHVPSPRPVNAPQPPARQLKRLTRQEARDVQSMSSDRLLPTLRPHQNQQEPGVSENFDPKENVIISIDKLTELLHRIHAASCRTPKLHVDVTDRLGLCVSLSVSCSDCSLQVEPMYMSDTIKKARGPQASALNEMMLLPALKTQMGLADIFTVLTCLNIKTPTKALVQRKFNSLCDKMITVNEHQMENNQRYIQQLTTHLPEETGIDAQYDVSYASRPQSGHEKAQQSFAAVIEHSTSRKLPIAVSIANKHCRLKGCDHANSLCRKSYGTDKSIAASERSLLFNSLNKINRSGFITLQSVTTDASTQLSKALRDFNTENSLKIGHYKCFIHKGRTLERHIRGLQLHSIPKAYDRQAFKQKLANCTRSRIRMELRNARKFTKDDNLFIRTSSAALSNITKCMSGDHRNCRKTSRVCKSHLKAYSTSSLPYGVHLQLNNTDMELVQKEIDTMFDTNCLKAVCKLFDTNMCESLNSAVYRLAPKSSCWSRNYSALCHSAVHSTTLGPSKSTIKLAEAAGIEVLKNSQMCRQLKLKDKHRQYDAKRKSSPACKQRRYFLRKRKSNRSLFANSLYSDGVVASSSAQEHNYGLRS